ncbi:MAG TPA: bifunctional protein-serine/threonine kinase/phosphatase [Gammaproteobacteria bacterium]|nr:bifunctional protein-serine/threonine kinase/phosphatase [Gammaproteobacteria bacterium]
MAGQLRISVGQHSDKGRKETNQDFLGFSIPPEPQLTAKGAALCLADGISSSPVSQVASQAAVNGFLADYYCTSDAWSVKKSARCVLFALHAWLHSQTRQSQFRYERDKGYVCAFSALIIKSTTAYLFHAGDVRIYRLRNGALELLTNDHRLWVSPVQSYLSRALGMNPHAELDHREVPVERDDVFLLATDGVYEHVDSTTIIETLAAAWNDLGEAARLIVRTAHDNGSDDNLSLQIARVDALPDGRADEIVRQRNELPLPPALNARMELDGYRILREIRASHRSHIYLAQDMHTGTPVVLKTPSVDLSGDPAYLDRMLLEEWIARRVDNAHVLKAWPPHRQRSYLYVVTEFIEGQTLDQWMRDNPRPDVETVRGIVEQIARGLRALHRLEILHQDLRPNNVMIDSAGTVKIIDFGAARVAGIVETASPLEAYQILGTEQYAAPEYFLGEGGTARSDLFSLGVITYQMLSGDLPYGAQVSRSRTRSAQTKLRYRSLTDGELEVPLWMDEAIKKAVHPAPYRRHAALSEFLHDLRYPNAAFLRKARAPLLERNPAAFWRVVSLVLLVIVIVLLAND